MAVQSQNRFPTGDVVVLERGEGTRAIVHPHGATVLSWMCNGEEQLFLSSKSIFDNKKAIRGGVPLVFPNFGPWTLGPQHGFARIKRWTLTAPPTQDAEGNVSATFQLEDDEETLKMWNYKFKVEYTLQLRKSSLVFNLVVHNTGTSSFDFTCLMHTYLRVKNIQDVGVTGLKGLVYVDKLRESKEFTEDREVITVDQNYDRVYKDSSSPVVVKEGGRVPVQMSAHNLPDIVVWNPWDQKAREMADFDDDGWLNMLCVEAGCVSSPVALASGAKFHCSQTLSRLPQ